MSQVQGGHCPPILLTIDTIHISAGGFDYRAISRMCDGWTVRE
jgi:hypothetical protein